MKVWPEVIVAADRSVESMHREEGAGEGMVRHQQVHGRRLSRLECRVIAVEFAAGFPIGEINDSTGLAHHSSRLQSLNWARLREPVVSE